MKYQQQCKWQGTNGGVSVLEDSGRRLRSMIEGTGIEVIGGTNLTGTESVIGPENASEIGQS